METETIRRCLRQLVAQHNDVIDEVSDELDDVVLSYITSVVEEPIESVDLEEFLSIMDAYVPGFAQISVEEIKIWFMDIHNMPEESPTQLPEAPAETPAKLETEKPIIEDESVKPKRSQRRRNGSRNSESDSASVQPLTPTWSDIATPKAQRTVSESSDSCMWPSLAEQTDSGISRSGSSSRTTSECPSEPSTDYSELIDLLVEMFPNLELQLIERNLQRFDYQLEDTVIKLLEHESGENNSKLVINKKPVQKDSNVTVRFKTSQKKQKKKDRKKSGHRESLSEESVDGDEVLTASELKSLIVDKYSFIPTDQEGKRYTPKLQTNVEKKLIRYRNGQVVSTKGERFSEVKKEVTEEMKKTFVNLKPARQYRFH